MRSLPMTFPLHPTFDALSAFVDGSNEDVSQARAVALLDGRVCESAGPWNTVRQRDAIGEVVV